MTITAELDERQIEDLDLTITITMPVRHWKLINEAIAKTQVDQWNRTKSEFIQSINKTINGMTGQLEGEYPNNSPQK